MNSSTTELILLGHGMSNLIFEKIKYAHESNLKIAQFAHTIQIQQHFNEWTNIIGVRLLRLFLNRHCLSNFEFIKQDC